MTAKQLVIEIEENLNNALALIDMIEMAATSESIELSNASVERVAIMAVLHLKKAIETCENIPE